MTSNAFAGSRVGTRQALRARSPIGLLLLLLGVLASVRAYGADAPTAPATNAATASTATSPAASTATGKCASVVIRHCRARFVADPSAARTPGARPNEAPGRWEAERNADPDSNEILVEENRLRDPAVHEAFERYLRAGPGGMLTRNATGGARCTTIASTGATFCSHPGAETPSSSLPHTDFSDAVF
jgi:hypothetical protein